MAQVSLAIGGRDYVVSCADGEEKRLESLGVLIDESLREGADPGALSETRALLYAALFLADKLKDIGEAPAPEAPTAEGDERSAKALENLAERVEAFATRLEKESASS
ncbi:cell division protein ZapA [Novosphingopyxis sp. YJ-S2-01]|uniref:cell division protein ZapA n=1 Tax=Novosphingopyxis sp. YJ-S2-01 TaxID=2794021 RepID=UPI0018DD5039|nr:cell division protein ZapA [Novosphingopyxis sp. YJ-S2-01]MBH9538138.1 cell division protein ZapA [Novosphingopyxis sp. YJ-S2-01]